MPALNFREYMRPTRGTLKRDTSPVLDTAHVHRLASNSPGKRKGRRSVACLPRFLYLPPVLSPYAAGRARSRQSNSGRGGKRTLRTASPGGRAWRRERL